MATVGYHVREIFKILDKPGLVKRYSLFPIQDQEAYEFYKRQEIANWTADELDFNQDVPHYESLPPDQLQLIDTILAFFLTGDGMVSQNLLRFLLECETYEQQLMFIAQLKIESVHAETYGRAAFTLVRSEEKMRTMLEKAEESPAIKAKAQFMDKWMLSDRPYPERLLAFAAAEGIFFPNLFAAIFWFRSLNLFPNFIRANELIAKDESLHRNFGCFLFKKFGGCSPEIALEIINDAVAAEDISTECLLPQPIRDLNADDLKKFTRLLADNLLVQCGFKCHWEVVNPFKWMGDISMEQKSNFYEVTPAAYTQKSLTDILNWEKQVRSENQDMRYSNPEDVEL